LYKVRSERWEPLHQYKKGVADATPFAMRTIMIYDYTRSFSRCSAMASCVNWLVRRISVQNGSRLNEKPAAFWSSSTPVI